MKPLTVAAMLWLAVHIGLTAPPLRHRAVAILGETRYRAAFSLLAIGSFLLLAHAWTVANGPALWLAPQWLRLLLAAAMLPVFLLFVGGLLPRRQDLPATPATGVLRVTRHPVHWSVVLWAAVHLLGTGEVADMLFYGTLLLTAAAGMRSRDRRLARRDPEAWRRLSTVTSVMPFAAIRQRRNRFVPAEIGWAALCISVAAWAALLWLHPVLFGVTPLL